MTEKILNVYQRLAEVRKAVPYLKKNKKARSINTLVRPMYWVPYTQKLMRSA